MSAPKTVFEIAAPPPVDPDLVETVEELLREVKSGEVIAVGIAGARRGGSVSYRLSVGGQRLALLAAVSLLHDHLITKIKEV